MKLLVDKLGFSVDHLSCLVDNFIENNHEFQRINQKLISEEGEFCLLGDVRAERA